MRGCLGEPPTLSIDLFNTGVVSGGRPLPDEQKEAQLLPYRARQLELQGLGEIFRGIESIPTIFLSTPAPIQIASI